MPLLLLLIVDVLIFTALTVLYFFKPEVLFLDKKVDRNYTKLLSVGTKSMAALALVLLLLPKTIEYQLAGLFALMIYHLATTIAQFIVGRKTIPMFLMSTHLLLAIIHLFVLFSLGL